MARANPQSLESLERFDCPEAVVEDTALSVPQKRRVLRRFARMLRAQLFWPDPISWAACYDLLRRTRRLQRDLRRPIGRRLFGGRRGL